MIFSPYSGRRDFFNSRNPVMLSAEVTPRPGEEAEIVLANTKRVINRAWSVL